MADKTAIVTGSSGGIGGAAAALLAANGYRVVLHYHRGESAAQALCERIRAAGGDALLCRADLRERAEVDAMASMCLNAFGRVDLLINNAGIAQTKLFTDITPDDWAQMFAVNVTGTYHACQSVLPFMVNRKAGKIVNISSIWGMVGGACEVHYSAAKAAVIGLTRALAKELGPSGIQVNCVAPGVIRTDMLAPLGENDLRDLADKTPLMRLGTPEDVAAAILFLASPAGDFFTGQVLSPNGGFVIGA